jgi:hypothetical protein
MKVIRKIFGGTSSQSAWRRCRGGLLAIATACIAIQSGAVARQGGTTDDSVCDLGRTYERTSTRDNSWIGDFIKAKCKNGQLLMGSSVVPAGGFESEIMGLSKANCQIADIQARRFQGNAGPITMEFEEVRCRITKLPK